MTELNSTLIAALAGYWLGALPTAYTAARLCGVDIFSVGSGQAGATNVWREVSHRVGLIVFVLDAAKGISAVLVAYILGMSGASAVLAAGGAAVLGHWNSPFTRFRGGDGVSILAGIVFGVAPVASCVALTAAAIVRWRGSFSHPTLWGGLIGILAIMPLALLSGYGFGPEEYGALIILASAILLHSYWHHRKRRLHQVHRETDSVEDSLDRVERRV